MSVQNHRVSNCGSPSLTSPLPRSRLSSLPVADHRHRVRACDSSFERCFSPQLRIDIPAGVLCKGDPPSRSSWRPRSRPAFEHHHLVASRSYSICGRQTGEASAYDDALDSLHVSPSVVLRGSDSAERVVGKGSNARISAAAWLPALPQRPFRHRQSVTAASAPDTKTSHRSSRNGPCRARLWALR